MDRSRALRRPHRSLALSPVGLLVALLVTLTVTVVVPVGAVASDQDATAPFSPLVALDAELPVVLDHLSEDGFPVGRNRDRLGGEQRRGLCLAREFAGLRAHRGDLAAEEVDALLSLRAPLSAPARAVDGLNVSVTCQATWYAQDGSVFRITRATTGRKSGWTPVGTFNVTWRADGWSTSSIYKEARLYRIHHFKGPVGFHGVADPSWIKTSPVSHGCVRIPNNDMDWLAKRMPTGSLVRVYGTW
jgi:hypothetical protein